MSKQCTICRRTYPTELKYCPHCGAWAEAPSAPHPAIGGEKSSSGEILLDPMQPPPAQASTGQPAPMNPPVGAGSDDVIEIDWEEVESPAAEAGGKGKATEAPARGKPTQFAGSRPPTKIAEPGDMDVLPDETAKPMKSSSADFELGEAPSSRQDDLIDVPAGISAKAGNQTAGNNDDPDEVAIADFLGAEGGSEVQLLPEGSRAASGPDWKPTEDDEFAQWERPETRADQSGQPVGAAVARPAPMAAAAKSPGGVGRWIGGGIVGAALGTAACFGLWMAGIEPPASWRGQTQPSSPSVSVPVVSRPVQDSPAASAADDPRALLDRGDFAAVADIDVPMDAAAPDRATKLATRGEARWLALVQKHGKNLRADDPSLQRARQDLEQANTGEAAFWLGQIQERTGDIDGARKTYTEALQRFKGNALLESAIDRLDVIAPVKAGTNTSALIPNSESAYSVLPAILLTHFQSPDGEPANKKEVEAGTYFWKAAKLAQQQKYGEALEFLNMAKAVHDERRLARSKKSQNPNSDPAEEIFLRACDELQTFWQIQERLQKGGYATATKGDWLKATEKALADAKAPKSDAGLASLQEKLKTDRDVVASDPMVRDVGKAIDQLLNAKKAAREQVARVEGILRDAKYVSAEQPDLAKGLQKLLADRASGDAQSQEAVKMLQAITGRVKEDKDAAAADPDGKDVGKSIDAILAAKKKFVDQLAAFRDLLKEGKYVSDQQPDLVKGLTNLLDDQKRTGEAPAALAAAANILRGAKYDQPTVAKAVEQVLADKAKAEQVATQGREKLKSAENTVSDLTVRLQKAQEAEKAIVARMKAAENTAKEADGKVKAANDAALDAATKLKQAESIQREIAQTLAPTRVVGADARGATLVRGVEQLVASALAAPKNGTAALSPLARRPETGPSDLLSAERHYQRGLTNFWAGRYWAAENDFYDAIRAANSIGADARYYYFLGLTQLAQGKLDEAREMFRMAGLLEKDRRPPSAVVSRALERVQGGLRRAVEEHRP